MGRLTGTHQCQQQLEHRRSRQQTNRTKGVQLANVGDMDVKVGPLVEGRLDRRGATSGDLEEIIDGRRRFIDIGETKH